MSTTTTNYGLIKPDTTDPILIGQLNDNADAIDAALKENADAIENKPDAADIPTPSTAAPAMDGTAAAGTSTDYARADHVHPSDTSKQDTLNAAQLAAANSGIDSAKVDQIETNKNNILIEDVTANFVAKEGYTVTSASHVYKQGNHIFGILCVSKDSGNYSGSENICRNFVNIPLQAIANGCYMSAGQWQINGVGYVFIQKGGSAQSGEITITDRAGTNTHCFINLDYVTN